MNSWLAQNRRGFLIVFYLTKSHPLTQQAGSRIEEVGRKTVSVRDASDRLRSHYARSEAIQFLERNCCCSTRSWEIVSVEIQLVIRVVFFVVPGVPATPPFPVKEKGPIANDDH